MRFFLVSASVFSRIAGRMKVSSFAFLRLSGLFGGSPEKANHRSHKRAGASRAASSEPDITADGRVYGLLQLAAYGASANDAARLEHARVSHYGTFPLGSQRS